MTRIVPTQDVRCPFSGTIEFIARLHQSGSQHLLGPFAGFRTPVVCDLHEALDLHWRARAGLPLPEMSGLLTVRPNGPLTQMRIDAHYEPPFGLRGRLFDVLAGRHIARRTVPAFLAELRTFIEAEWRKERVALAARIEGA